MSERTTGTGRIVEDVIEALEPLGNKLGIAVEQLYGWALRRNYFVGAFEVVAGVLLLIGAYLLVGQARKNNVRIVELLAKEIGAKEREILQESSYAYYAGAVTVVVISFLFLYFGVMRIVAPEFSVISDISKLVRSL